MRSEDQGAAGRLGRVLRRRPSHSTVIAWLALFVALGGGSFAVAALTGQEKRVVKRIANKEIAKRAPKVKTRAADQAIFPFDAAQFAGLVSMRVTAPRDGTLFVSGQVNVNRDLNSPNPTEVIARGAVDGQAATSSANARSTQDGAVDQSISVAGATRVGAGRHTVSLQAREVSSGSAFLTGASVTTLFVPGR